MNRFLKIILLFNIIMGRNFQRRSESFLGEENYDDGQKNYLTQVIQRKI